jgi:hypothetical protein
VVVATESSHPIAIHRRSQMLRGTIRGVSALCVTPDRTRSAGRAGFCVSLPVRA